MTAATNINDVLNRLDHIIIWSKEKQSRIGYFATLYRRMTKAVKIGINENKFADAKRMEKLDVIFANRYIQAWDAYINKKPCTTAWCAAFDACDNMKLIVLQHLILGINTHINLDLAIAAAETSPGDAIHDLKGDFEKINTVIANLTEKIQLSLSNVWFPLRALTRISNNREDAVINFSINAARRVSWDNAVALAYATGQGRTNYINLINNSVVTIAKRIVNPSLATSFLLRPVRIMEDRNVSKIIDLLQK